MKHPFSGQTSEHARPVSELDNAREDASARREVALQEITAALRVIERRDTWREKIGGLLGGGVMKRHKYMMRFPSHHDVRIHGKLERVLQALPPSDLTNEQTLKAATKIAVREINALRDVPADQREERFEQALKNIRESA
ncbi:MAG: hypothetical protein WCX61_01425 [Candidatus Peribacteraceae bacterium]|jgi:hypothetical protein